MAVRVYKESDDQKQLVSWFSMQHPKLNDLFIHVPNGQNVGPRAGEKLRKMGLKAGFPDMVLFVATETWPAMVLEMKAPGGRVSKDQGRVMTALIEQGYCVCTCWSFDEAKSAITAYLSGGPC